MRFLSVASDSFLIELSSLEETLALYRTLLVAALHGVQDLIPAAKTVLVLFDPIYTDFHQLKQHITALEMACVQVMQTKEVIVPICYNGEDLATVAELQGLSISEVVAKHQQSIWQVAFIGFAPGFAYLNSLDQPFSDIPRLRTPRKKIPAGALGLAGQYSGMYPKDSPGGWQLIGHSLEKMWDLERSNPALLLPGMQVCFEDVTAAPNQIQVASQLKTAVELENSIVDHSTQHSVIGMPSQAVFKITAASLQMTFQDQGRFQQSNIGVGHAGAMDLSALRRANRIVGNPDNSACIELLGGGMKGIMQSAAILTVTGAETKIDVKYADGQRTQFTSESILDLDQGDEFHIRIPTAGLRNYLAVRGGMTVDAVLGSCAYDSLAKLGPAPLQSGDVICAAQHQTTALSLNEVAIQNLPQLGDLVEVDVLLGPRTDWFDMDSVELLFMQPWLVSNDSNRIGLRLMGEQPLTRLIQQELESEGTCIGALQVPPSGQPVLFMNDHPLTGGYPVIGVVARHHLDLIAQIPAGCQIQFKKIAEFIDLKA